MGLYLTNVRLCVISAVCALLVTAGIAMGSDVNSPAGANDFNGPTVTLSYGGSTSEKNPFASFMYFVPLVSPTLVDVETSAGNEQMVSAVSYERKVGSRSFYVSFEFEMTGEGFHKYTFDPAEVIAAHVGSLKKGQTLANMIDYMRFEGPGFGRIEVRGTISTASPDSPAGRGGGSTQIVNEVDLQFNARGRKSPVTLGLYTIKPVNGEYKYENRSSQLIARVDTFIFKKTEGEPRMGIKLASVDKASTPNGFFAGVIGAIANLFINPPRVDKLGNDTMLDFGLALFNEKPSFTFPKAKNLRENKIVPGD